MQRSALVLFAVLAFPAVAGEVDELVRALGADEWSAREEASRRLFEMGPSARSALQRAVESEDAEIARRASGLAARIDGEVERAQWYVDLREETDEYLSKMDHLGRQGDDFEPVRSWIPPTVRGRVVWVDADRLGVEVGGGDAVGPGTPFLVLRDGDLVGRGTWIAEGVVLVWRGWTIRPLRAGDTIVDSRVPPERVAEVLEACKRSIEHLRANGIDVARLSAVKVPAPLDGKIVAVNAGVGLVMVNLGEKHGVEKGMNFTVFRGDAYVGQVIVEEVFPDMASARIDRRFAKKDDAEGDDVTTRLR